MNAKKIIKSEGYTKITSAGHWQGAMGKIPVILIQRPYGDGITIGGDRRQLGRQVKNFARSLAG